MNKKWKCDYCGKIHNSIQFQCKKCAKPPKGRIGNFKIVEREVGIRDFIDRCNKCGDNGYG